jgi:PTH1 family peptidyl-tRNA hydrolase
VPVKLVVGLGNPGREYEWTPHNVGFMAVEALAERLECRLRTSSRFEARLGAAVYRGQDLLLVEPQTFMNASGRAVGAILRYRKLTPADLVVVVDDADLALGALRLRKQGSSGGHRGLISIEEALGTTAYERVRIGIGRGQDRRTLIDHVLSAFTAAERETVAAVTQQVADAVLCAVELGVDTAMNRYNARRNEPGGAAETMAGGKV